MPKHLHLPKSSLSSQSLVLLYFRNYPLSCYSLPCHLFSDIQSSICLGSLSSIICCSFLYQLSCLLWTYSTIEFVWSIFHVFNFIQFWISCWSYFLQNILFYPAIIHWLILIKMKISTGSVTMSFKVYCFELILWCVAMVQSRRRR